MSSRWLPTVRSLIYSLKCFYPLLTKLVVAPAVFRDAHNPVVRYTWPLIPASQVVLRPEDDQGWDDPPHRVDAYNCWSHSRSPCCTVFGRNRRSEPVTTARVEFTPIMKPGSSKFRCLRLGYHTWLWYSPLAGTSPGSPQNPHILLSYNRTFE